MSSVRKRVFAVSVVATVSLADLGCALPKDGGETVDEPEVEADGRTSSDPRPPDTDKPDPDKPEPDTTDPDTTATDELPEAKVAASVVTRDDGTCWEDMTGDFKCPKNATCNPPPPRRVKCPEPELPQATNVQDVSKRQDGTCWEWRGGGCPKGARCNPPPPRQVECPPGVKEDPL